MKARVSVLITFYNQEEYVNQTLESVINQKTNFDVKNIKEVHEAHDIYADAEPVTQSDVTETPVEDVTENLDEMPFADVKEV